MGGSSSKNEQKDKHAGPRFRTKVTSCDTKETIKKMEETGLRPPVGTDSEEGGEAMSPPGAGQAQPEAAGSSVKKGKKKEAKKK
ncbi:unnamed protein product [Orchesella dallaii]|uniref:Uncharacterized protein n=1 Tax=Orchesella dallaii TaxID=48710 RepID=A0ABP1RRH1_9HEXA